MTGKEATLQEFFYGTEPIIIPVYQRNYTWGKADCKLLFDDILAISKDENMTHFIGSVVHVKHSDGNIIIDGQQRITTISILLLALRNGLLKGQIQSDNDQLAAEIEFGFLVNQFSKDKARRMKLKPFRDDCKAFDALFGNDSNFVVASKITENYLYFLERIVNEHIDAESLFKAIKRLEFVKITLEPSHGDNAQQIFESINSTGVRLTETDKIRNYVLMNLDAATQEDYYNNYWLQIENNTAEDMEDFVRDFLTVFCGFIPNKQEVYRTFKDYASREYSASIFPLLELLKHYSEIFRNIKSCKVGSDTANKIMADLEQLEITVTYPFLMAFFDYAQSVSLEQSEIEKVLDTIEVFLFRRIIRGYYNTGLNKVFYNLHNRVLKTQHDDAKYSEVFIYLLQHGISYWEFPDDESFRIGFRERDVYKMRPNYRLYVFYKIEESLNKEAAGVKKNIEDGVLSIEHVMPQTLTDDWRAELGSDFTEEDYKRWIHNIGNLTLTAYNSEYSNRKFSEKRDGVPSLPDMKGFKDSLVAMNKFISSCEHWTKAEMEKRCELMADHAIRLWKYPTSDFKPLVIEDEFIPIDSEYDFKNRNIKSYTFNGATVSVDSWASALTQIVKTLFEKEPSILYKLVSNSNEVFFSDKEEKGYNKIAEGVFLYVACNTKRKVTLIQHLLSLYKLEPDDISVALYPKRD